MYRSSDVTSEPRILTHILQKLNLRDRVQAIVLAYTAGFVEAPSLSGPGERGR